MCIENKGLHYNDVYLIPSYFDGESRSNISTQCILGKFIFDLPVIPANMKCVMDINCAEKITESWTAPYIMHRFGDTFKFVEDANKQGLNFISISIGVKETDSDLLNKIKANGLQVDCITIDIAHGHSKLMSLMISKVKNLFPDAILIAGNIGTPQAAADLCKWGADVLKVGIGPGAACTTKLKTGFHTPMFSTIMNVADARPTNIPIIADGGISFNGDIAKAIVAGADFVMCGKMFAELSDSPAETLHTPQGIFKEYYGSASEFNKGHTNNIEGKRELLQLNPLTFKSKLKEIKQDLQSAISYAGCYSSANISALKYCQWGVHTN
jgi:GMP reductase